MIFLDFETRCRLNLKDVGAFKYALEAEPLCLAYAKDDGPVELWIPEYDPFPGPCPAALDEALLNGELFAAHNATFEYFIWKYALPSWPTIPRHRFVDTAAMAAVVSLPRSLKGCAETLGLKMQKDSGGAKLIQKLCKPRKKSPLWNCDPKDLEAFYSYCKQDVEVERAIFKALPRLSEFEQYIWALTLEMNEYGLGVDLSKVQIARDMLTRLAENADIEAKRLTDGRLDSVRQVVETCEWARSRGVEIYDLQAPTVKRLLLKDLPADVRKVLLLRQEVGKSSTAKYQSILDHVCDDGRVRDNLVYHGAGPGRWTGAGIQIQNFPRGELKEIEVNRVLQYLEDTPTEIEREFKSVAKPLSSCLRAMIVPAPGKEFICSDFSAIEARILSWVVGDEADLNKFRQGIDIYVELAASIFEIPIEQIDKRKRTLGKTGRLALGFGMGPDRFIAKCKEYDLIIDKNTAQKTVNTYRKICHLVPLFWRQIESDFKVMADRRLKLPIDRPGKYRLENVMISGKRFTRMILPSGRPLYYCELKIEEDGLTFEGINGVSRKWERMRTWGGVFTENLVQAIARDLLAEAMHRVDLTGWRIVTTVHDEILCEEPIEKHRTVEELNTMLCVAPSWAPDLPLKAEGWKGPRYKK